MGLRDGLIQWRKYLKSFGHCAITEISWLSGNIPKELSNYWIEAYPKIRTIEENLKIIKEIGYKNINHFTIPESSWWANYYNPIKKKLKLLVEKYKNQPKAMEIINAEKLEMEMYRKYSKYYGYVFYIMQKY
ncbi:hypothetical protein ACFL6I_11815 [candidate division KSB1 bacterium]